MFAQTSIDKPLACNSNLSIWDSSIPWKVTDIAKVDHIFVILSTHNQLLGNKNAERNIEIHHTSILNMIPAIYRRHFIIYNLIAAVNRAAMHKAI